ncbi:hypothetical protein [Paraburkholderia bannensis]|uniref:hypothetical protein n=1 Tax=Paraburkholderia bannensis TaxID=765414 RepID=UPI002ABD93C4|nr:hypothetical protein [Paraburkholderia bannensis]
MEVTYFFMPGGGVGMTPDGTIPTGAVVCTDEQYQNSQAYAIDDATTPPSIVDAPAIALTIAQQAAKAMTAGLAIESASTPSINGVYAVDQLSQMDVIAIETSLNAGKGFPGGATAFGYPDAAGALHSFSQANFADFAAAVRDFVYGCKSAIGGQSTMIPSATVAIA